jgi:hypothetical protein
MVHTFKVGREDLSVVDRTIGIIKRALAEGTPSVAKAVEGINERGNESTLHGASPNELRAGDQVAIFERMWDEAEHMRDNARALHARGERLRAAGAFRVYQKPILKGRRRADEPIWSREVFRVARIEGPEVVGDDGRRHLTKEVLPVSVASRPAPQAPLRERPRALLQRYADRAAEILRGRGGATSLQVLSQQLTAELGDLREALRLAGAQATRPIVSLAQLFPEVLVVRGNRVVAAPSGSGS